MRAGARLYPACVRYVQQRIGVMMKSEDRWKPVGPCRDFVTLVWFGVAGIRLVLLFVIFCLVNSDFFFWSPESRGFLVSMDAWKEAAEARFSDEWTGSGLIAIFVFFLVLMREECLI